MELLRKTFDSRFYYSYYQENREEATAQYERIKNGANSCLHGVYTFIKQTQLTSVNKIMLTASGSLSQLVAAGVAAVMLTNVF